MFIRGTDKHVPLTFVRIQPYVSPKIELSDERQELVDVRVLPVIFRFAKPDELTSIPESWSMSMSARSRTRRRAALPTAQRELRGSASAHARCALAGCAVGPNFTARRLRR